MGQVFLTAFYIFWLCAVLVLLLLIWRNGVRRARTFDQALIDALRTSVESAKVAAEAARTLAKRGDGHADSTP